MNWRVRATMQVWWVVGTTLLMGRGAGAQDMPHRVVRLPPLAGVDEIVPTPVDNPFSADGIALGRRLFFDRRLSRDSSRSCASCHLPSHAFADTVARSSGIGGARARRNTPSLVNRAYGRAFMWDGAAESLEAQVLRPIVAPDELGLPLAMLLRRLRGDSTYRIAFAASFPQPSPVSARNVARALAMFVRTIRSGDAPVDRHAAGEREAMSPSAQRGEALFRGRANCVACHIGPTFTDEDFHDTGVPGIDPGRARVTGQPVDKMRFRTPTLRDVARTAPYMHDGSIATLEEVIAFYDRGQRPRPGVAREIHPLSLTPGERTDLVEFLRALTGRTAASELDEGHAGALQRAVRLVTP